jgi:glutamyl-tRNA synthetase
LGLLCFSAEALDAARKEQEEQGKTFIYNHTNREILDTSLVISKKKLPKIANGDAYVIRFKTQLVKPCICKISVVT